MAVIPGTACLLSPITIVALRVFVRFPTSIGASPLLGTPRFAVLFLHPRDRRRDCNHSAFRISSKDANFWSLLLPRKKKKRKDFRKIGAETRNGRRPVKLQISWKVNAANFRKDPGNGGRFARTDIRPLTHPASERLGQPSTSLLCKNYALCTLLRWRRTRTLARVWFRRITFSKGIQLAKDRRALILTATNLLPTNYDTLFQSRN